MPKKVTSKQLRYLLSKVSPLSPAQKGRFERELEGGYITVIRNQGGSTHGERGRKRGKRSR